MSSPYSSSLMDCLPLFISSLVSPKYLQVALQILQWEMGELVSLGKLEVHRRGACLSLFPTRVPQSLSMTARALRDVHGTAEQDSGLEHVSPRLSRWVSSTCSPVSFVSS